MTLIYPLLLQLNTTIRRADLSYNGFHDSVDQLADVLAENKTLVYLDVTSNRLTDIDMGHIVKGSARNFLDGSAHRCCIIIHAADYSKPS